MKYEERPESTERVCIQSTCFVEADHLFLLFSVMLKSFLMQLYVGPCHVVSAYRPIAVAMSVPIENLADCEVRGVIRFLQTETVRSRDIHRRLVTIHGDICRHKSHISSNCII